MALIRCTFCGKEQEDYKGTYLIKNDGTTHYYCSSKCNKNHLKLERDKRKLKWTNAFYESRDRRYAAEARVKETADRIASEKKTEHKAPSEKNIKHSKSSATKKK